MDYQPIIGLEVHIQLKTKSKMFCGCPNDPFGSEPNTLTCPTCLGLPGALPVPNKKAVEDALLLGLALNCQVNRESYFERKNYFYPDLPKGYQISQYKKPLTYGGWLTVRDKKIRINRVHLEEDTGKLIHQIKSEEEHSLVDFNRSGVPLVEVVSEPDFSSVEEVDEYLRELRRTVRSLDISGADMEKGSMRLEPTVNLKISCKGKDVFTPLSEIKNINSFRFVRKAISFEIERQRRSFQETGEEKQSGNKRTVGFSESSGETFLQREKEEAHDYRYFPEPDIPPLFVDDVWLKIVEGRRKELLVEKEKRFAAQYHLTPVLASGTTVSTEKADYFEGLVKEGLAPQKAANLVINKPELLVGVGYQDLAKKIREEAAATVSNEVQLTAWTEGVLRENPTVAEQFRRGKIEVLQFLVGQVMRKSGGRADPKMVRRLLEERLKR